MDPQLIATLVSLIGVVTGIALFYWGKRLERQSVNKAILAEVRRLIIVVGLHKDWFEQAIESGNSNLPLIEFSTPIYDEHAKNLGLLHSSVVASVAEFYGYVKFLNSLQLSRVDYIKLDKLPLFEQMYFDSLTFFIDANRTAFDKAFHDYGIQGQQRQIEG